MLNWDAADQNDAFEEWYDFLSSYFIINGVSDEKKYHYILLSAGHKGHELWKTWMLSDEEKKNPTVVFEKFKEHMIGTVNKWVMRLELSMILQKEGESVEDFVCRLKTKANLCKFPDGNTRDEQVTFQLIKGIRWPEERKNLIKKGNELKLDEAVRSAQSFQATMQNTNSFVQGQSSIGAVKVWSFHPCKFCGSNHPPKKCPAYKKKCSSCGRENHFAKMCRSQNSKNVRKRSQSRNRSQQNERKSNEKYPEKKQVHHVEKNDVLDCGEIIVVNVSEVTADERQSIMAKLNAKPKDVQCQVTLRVKVDTGANGNILPLRCLRQMYPNEADPCSRLGQSRVRLVAANGTFIEHFGHIDIPLQLDASDWFNARFYVCDIAGPAILSCDLSEKLGIIEISKSKNISNVTSYSHYDIDSSCSDKVIRDKENLKELYPKCFEGIGHFTKKYTIDLKDDANPVVSPPRKYPIQLKDEICNKLQEMEKLGVIVKCDDDSTYDWINSLAFSRKVSGELRICLDPRNLNKAIKRTYHKIPTLEEISYELAGATVFSKLDAKHGYWSIELDDESSNLCTFNSPAGKYKFCRLPFGLCVSQDIFQKYMDDVLHKAGNGIIGIADDFVVYGKTVAEHNDALHRLMTAAREYGLVFRYEKCEILKDSIEFYGLIWSSEGMKPDVKKCDDIRSRPAPRNRSELQSFLGLVQYLSPFIPHLSDKSSIVRQLLKHDTDWLWEKEHQQAFDALKDSIHSSMTLTYFDPNKPSVIEVDASMAGLGAALIQGGKPIAFTSKALTPTESRYANIERELLAVVHGLEKFHTYIFGKSLTVYSDHKPLESIILKQLSLAPPRLQRMLLRIQPYDICIKYRPGKDMVYADYLSRVQPSVGPNIELEQAIHLVQISASQLEKLRLASQEDAELSVLQEQVVSGWPMQAKLVPKMIRSYWSLKDYLSVENGLMYNGQRLVIPKVFRNEYLDRIHAGHQGVTKSQLRAKDSIYWPNMMSDIERKINDCGVCLQNARSVRKEPMLSHELPSQPWEILSSDLFELDGHSYILIADHYSKMPFVRGLKSTSCSEVVKFCKDMFAIHGVPKRLYSDNGPQYSAAEFRNFSLNWDFEHITSSPHYPQSNGFAERMVGVVKSALKKAKQSGNDPQMSLLCLRSTPLDNRTPSPAELLYGRKIRSNLPAKGDCKLSSLEDKENFVNKSDKIAHYYNQNAGSELPELFPGMKVVVQKPNEQSWLPGIIKEKCVEPRSYVVKMSNGSELRRNRRFLKELSSDASSNFEFDKGSLYDDDFNDSLPVSNFREGFDSKPSVVSFSDHADLTHVRNDVPVKDAFNSRRSARNIKKPSRLIEQCEVLVKYYDY